jgi:hypothetical protein
MSKHCFFCGFKLIMIKLKKQGLLVTRIFSFFLKKNEFSLKNRINEIIVFDRFEKNSTLKKEVITSSYNQEKSISKFADK